MDKFYSQLQHTRRSRSERFVDGITNPFTQSGILFAAVVTFRARFAFFVHWLAEHAGERVIANVVEVVTFVFRIVILGGGAADPGNPVAGHQCKMLDVYAIVRN